MTEKPTTGKPEVSLLEFARDERLAVCAVCQLPLEVREQMVSARRQKIHRETVLAWLDKLGYSIDDDTLTVHGAGHHDRRLKELS
jgi:hypothetical protein